MKLRVMLDAAAGSLRAAGAADPEYDARELMKAAFGVSTAKLLLMFREDSGSLDAAKLHVFREYLKLRAARVPLQRILGTSSFMGFDIELGDSALIPREDTETLVETVLQREKSVDISVLDLGTGSGAIAIALKLLGGYELVAASDISRRALDIAKVNAAAHKAGIDFFVSDLFYDIPQSFDVIVSNPPYIPTGIIDTLEPEVRDHDPRLALDGGEDGLRFYRRIAAECRGTLDPGGRLYLEIGADETGSVSDILADAGFTGIFAARDLGGRDRVLGAVAAY